MSLTPRELRAVNEARCSARGVIEYGYADASTPSGLQREVSRWLSDGRGWEPIGSPFRWDDLLYQAMVRRAS